MKTKFNIFKEINKIQWHIKKSKQILTEKSTKKSLIGGPSKRPLELEFKSNQSIKSKSLKWIVNTTNNTRHEKHTIKNKTDKNWKKLGTTYCLGCKDYTDNFKPQEVTMTKKVLWEKSNCALCRSSKSRFLKQKQNNKKWLNNNINRQFVLF